MEAIYTFLVAFYIRDKIVVSSSLLGQILIHQRVVSCNYFRNLKILHNVVYQLLAGVRYLTGLSNILALPGIKMIIIPDNARVISSIFCPPVSGISERAIW